MSVFCVSRAGALSGSSPRPQLLKRNGQGSFFPTLALFPFSWEPVPGQHPLSLVTWRSSKGREPLGSIAVTPASFSCGNWFLPAGWSPPGSHLGRNKLLRMWSLPSSFPHTQSTWPHILEHVPSLETPTLAQVPGIHPYCTSRPSSLCRSVSGLPKGSECG